MRKILVIGLILLLIGGLIMPAQAHSFTIHLGKDGANASFYMGGNAIGKADKNGKVILDTSSLEEGKMYNVTVKKEGYIDKVLVNQIYKAGGNINLHCAYSGYRIIPLSEMSDFTHEIPHEPTSEPTLVPEPLLVPEPTNHKSQKQRITDLENTTAEQETKITGLEKQITTILNWIKNKFGDVI